MYSDKEIIDTLTVYFENDRNKVSTDVECLTNYRNAVCFIIADFRCPNMYESKGKYRGYIECGKCKCLYDCGVNQDFRDLLKKLNCRFEWIYGYLGIVTRLELIGN